MTLHEGTQINKYISSSGFCSRREADKLIEQGRVTLNSRIALPTARVGENDKVAIDGETIRTGKREPFYIAFNKPKGVTSTTDLQDKSNIISYINHNRRIFPVGRLDKDSEGLILLTDDGDIVNKILRAENGHEKEYVVAVNKPIVGEFINKMSSGIPILDTVTKPCKVRQEGSKKFRITLVQGLNRQIRRMCEYMGYEVVSLKRVRIMDILLGDLPLGKFRKLLPSELRKLQEQIADSSPAAIPEKKGPKPGKSFSRERKKFDKGSTGTKPGSRFMTDKSNSFTKDKPGLSKSKKPANPASYGKTPAKPKPGVRSPGKITAKPFKPAQGSKTGFRGKKRSGK